MVTEEVKKGPLLNPYVLEDEYFYKFKEIIYKETRIKLSDMKKALVQARLNKRLRTLKLDTYPEYYEYFNNNYDEEVINFVNSITTNKTDFFRENKHFDYIKDVIFPEFEKKGFREIRIWSSGCSTGEEPYTIAFTYFDYFRDKKNPPALKILATDIDTNVLETASTGIYKSEGVEGIDLNILKRYFMLGKGDNEGFFKIKDFVKKNIFFRRLNLMNDAYPLKKKFDILFCRNVIIYFDKQTQTDLFKKFYLHLTDHGYMFIGHSENITGISNDYTLIGNTIYKKIIHK